MVWIAAETAVGFAQANLRRSVLDARKINFRYILFMPLRNNFQHQPYTAERPQAEYRLMDAAFPLQPGEPGYDQRLADCGRAVAEQVDVIYLMHGTFVGNDALGWTNQIEKLWPAAGKQLRSVGKKIVDVLADDTGNFTDEYASQLAKATALPVRRFDWSGENNHSARAVAAIRLLDRLFQGLEHESRVLLVCHSHAGNVLALTTNLLASDDDARDEFLKIIRPIFRDEAEQQCFDRVTQGLNQPGKRESLQLNIVTLGTPIRYGWDSGGFRKLIHFVHHVPRDGEPEWLSPVQDLKSVEVLKLDGDLVQQFGIAGTNVLPYVLDFKLMQAEQNLNRFLQPFGREGFWDNLKLGMRVHHDGETLLIQYEDRDGLASQMAGHGVYTQAEWLLFHLCEVGKSW